MALGAAMPVQLAVTVAPGMTVEGLVARDTGGSATPVTTFDAPPPPAKETVPEKLPVAVGLKRTDTVALAPADRPYEPPDKIENGAAVLALPLSTPLPTFFIVKVRSTEVPALTLPKSNELGVTSMSGVDTGTATTLPSGKVSVKLPASGGVHSPE
jgi:hypothetical protein